MNSILCAAGHSTRSQHLCQEHGIKSKCLLPVGPSTILEIAINELINIGVTRLVIVVGEHNLEEIRAYLTKNEAFLIALTTDTSRFRISLAVQRQPFHGTVAAVVSGMQLVEGPFLLVWSDMLFRFPHGFDYKSIPHNVVFTTSVSHLQSARFDGIVCSGNRVMAFSPRSVEKPGPFLINTGVYYIKDVQQLKDSISRIMYHNSETSELPIEAVLHAMLARGIPFIADSLEFFIDMGTTENYRENIRILYGG